MPWLESDSIPAAYESGVVLAQDEDWTIREGTALVTTQTDAGDGGYFLDARGERGLFVVGFSAGDTVRFRHATNARNARIWREPRA